ncbi:S1 domain-containing RNA-binding protein [Effusibacillus lacus]|uniref:RNA-binding protein S1 n=1 Tax=Effusibacillus lacus TaxID=1348429 RepID=A0A292YJU3_9BACL|nr:S1 domain-containing RNA-binding protein [Effusibacillus lacus]TCS74474.1 S1 RNA binding domain protein [Effusibacillus lacus]GAX88654.1 RNA-binding protein S1 [Effusibacillus lacus]
MSIELGSKLEGKVTGITHFGAFVLLPGGVTGLVHISEIADSYVKDINEHLKVNDTVTVKVLNVDKDGKIGLSIRQAVDKPVEPVGAPRQRGDRFESGGRNFERASRDRGHRKPEKSFEDKLSKFLKESEDRLLALKRSESKRGGRGGRRG